MTGYSRMALPPAEYRDARGEVIPYGSRWGAGGPPDDAYSRVTHPERFEPLQWVARGLIDHLAREYDVAVVSDPAFAADFRSPSGVEEAVRLVPAAPSAASLTFGFTNLPGVFVAAGAFQQFAFPACGCDACDEDPATQIDQLEETVLAIAGGGYREWASATDVGFSLRLRSGSSSGMEAAGDIAGDRLAAGRSALPSGGGAWQPWPKRT